MTKCIARRTVLKSALALAVLQPTLPALAQAPALPDHMRLLNVGGANVLVCKTEAGLVLIDTGPAEADLSEPLQAFSTDMRFTVFNTHWHGDQVGNNAIFGRLGPGGDNNMSAMIIAHEKTKLRMSTRSYDPQTDTYTRPAPSNARPHYSFYDKGSRKMGTETIDYGHLLLAHTDGDIYVHFRDSNVLAVGDVASPARDPALDWYGGGWIGGRVDAMDLLLGLADDATVIVPAYGPLITKAQLQAERDMMSFLYDTLVDQVRMGFTPEDSLASGVMDGLPRKFQDPQKFLYDAHKGLWAHHNKLAPNIV